MAVSGLVGVGIGQNDERAEQRSAEPGRQDDRMKRLVARARHQAGACHLAQHPRAPRA